MRKRARGERGRGQEGRRRARKGGEGYCSASAVKSWSGDNQTYPVVPMSLRLELSSL